MPYMFLKHPQTFIRFADIEANSSEKKTKKKQQQNNTVISEKNIKFLKSLGFVVKHVFSKYFG